MSTQDLEQTIITQALKDKAIPPYRFQEYILWEHPCGVTLLVDKRAAGQGATGKFYQAFYLDHGQLNSVGVKNIPPKHFRELELEVESVLYPEKTFEPMTTSDGSIAIFKPFLPGKTLDKIPPHQLAQLKFSDIFGLIRQFTDQIKQLHDANFSHNDLKPENILVDLDAIPPKLYIIDCGISNQAKHSHTLEKFNKVGNPVYFPPETLNVEGWYGIQPKDTKKSKTQIGKPSDVYMATSVILNLLGAHDPLRSRAKKVMTEIIEKKSLSQKEMKSLVSTPFSSEGLIDFPKKFPPEMREFISRFVARTQHVDYTKRPSIDEVSTFFRAAENLALRCEETSFDIEKNIYLAQMSLIDAGLWNPTLEKYAFQENSEVCDAIVALMRCGKQALIQNQDLIKILTNNTQSSQALAQELIGLGEDLRIVIAFKNEDLSENIALQTSSTINAKPSSNLYSTLLPPTLPKPEDNEHKKNFNPTDDIKTTSSPTELYKALKSGVSDNLKILIDTCPDLNWQDEDGNTALHLAVQNVDIDAIEALIEAHANLNIQNTKGETPLHWAIAQDDYVTITTLIETKKAKLDLKDKSGNDAATLLKSKDTQGIYADLLETVKPPSNLYSTLLPPPLPKPGENEYKKNSIPTDDIKATSPPTELYKALESGVSDDSTIEPLINTCRDLNWQDKKGNTALHLAVENGDIDTIEALIEAHANLNIQNMKGQTPLHWAIAQDDYSTTKILIESGKAKLDLKDQSGKDAATLLRSKNQIYVDLLKAAKSPPDNKHNNTPSKVKEDTNPYTSSTVSQSP